MPCRGSIPLVAININMRYFFVLLFALMLGSCDSAPKKGADGYRFGEKQYERNEVQVKIVTYKSQADYNKVLNRLKLPKTTAAFSTLSPPYDICTIHMIDPSIKYEPEFVGHEFLHCVYGQWHTDNKSIS